MRQVHVGAWLVMADAELKELAAAKEAWAAFQTARLTHEAVERAWAGACIASVFRQWTWLAAMKLSFVPESEYDDQGGTFRSISFTVSNLEAVSGVQLPEMLGDMEFDLEVAADVLQDELQDSVDSLYSALMDEYSHEDLDVTVRREQLGHLLERAEMDGAEAFLALFPEEVSLELEAGPPGVPASAEHPRA